MAGYQSPTHQGFKDTGVNPYPRGEGREPLSAHAQFEYGKKCREQGMSWSEVERQINTDHGVDYRDL